jgi:hypothetical protein
VILAKVLPKLRGEDAPGAGKQAIRATEEMVPDFTDPVQIPVAGGFRQNG